MRIDIVKTKVFPFSELSDVAKESAVENLSDINVDYEWWNWTYEDVKEIGKLIGINIDEIYFSGFSSQGDGACFQGSYEYKKNSVKAIEAYAPKDTELHRITKELQQLQKACFYSISASIEQSGHYMHRFCTNVCIDFENIHTGTDYFNQDTETEAIELLRDFMLWIYRQLEDNYDYYTSKEAIIESIITNEYEFDVDGNIY